MFRVITRGDLELSKARGVRLEGPKFWSGDRRRCIARGGASIAVLLLAWSRPARADVEAFNQAVFGMNRVIEDAVVRPGVASYRRSVPATVQTWVGNVYRNLTEPVTATAHAIDGNVRATIESTVRVAMNSTLGILGTVDLAGRIGIPKRDNSFSGAVCRSGFPVGDYVVLPIVGATTAGITVAAGALMIGSTWVLSLYSTHLAVASVGIDAIASAAALENTVTGAGSDAVTYDTERSRFIEELDKLCRRA